MICSSENGVQRRSDLPPLLEQLVEKRPSVSRQQVVTLVPLALLAPLALQESLRLEPAQQGIERALVHDEALLRERLAQRVAVLLVAELGEHRHHQAAAPQ